MPAKNNGMMTRKDPGRVRGALTTALLLAATLMAGTAEAKSPWESIAEMIKAKQQAQATSTTTQTASLAAPLAQGAPSVGPLLQETPYEGDAAATTASQTRMTGSAATALASMVGTTQTQAAKADPSDPAKALNLGLESDENEGLLATNLFKNKEIRRLLGDEPRFIYDPADRPDPMVAPWVRRAAIFKELSVVAEMLTAQGEFDQAVAVYQRILQLNDPRFSGVVHAKLTAIAERQNAAAVAAIQAQTAVENIELPAWIHDNTTGVIISPGREMCLVGEYMLRLGDSVPNYPEVRICEIAPSKVVYQIRNKTFEVVLNAN